MKHKDENFEQKLQQNISVFDKVGLPPHKRRQLAQDIIKNQPKLGKRKPFYATPEFKRALSTAACLIIALTLIFTFIINENNRINQIKRRTLGGYGIGSGIKKPISGKQDGSYEISNAEEISAETSQSGADETEDEINQECSVEEEPDGTSYLKGNPADGQLYGIEVNDNSNIDFLSYVVCNFLDSSYDTPVLSRAEVKVTSKGKPVSNVSVYGLDGNGKTIAVARTDAKGIAYLYGGLFDNPGKTIAMVNSLGKSVPVVDGKADIETSDNAMSLKTANIMFVFDTSPEMEESLNYFKTHFSGIIDELSETTAVKPKFSFNAAYNDGTANTPIMMFTAEEYLIASKMNQVASINRSPASLDKILTESINKQNWEEDAAKVYVLVLGSSVDISEETITGIQSALEEAQRLGIRLIPVVADGDLFSQNSSLYRLLAASTGGTAVFIADSSLIRPEDSDVNGVTAEKLDKLLCRIIKYYILPR